MYYPIVKVAQLVKSDRVMFVKEFGTTVLKRVTYGDGVECVTLTKKTKTVHILFYSGRFYDEKIRVRVDKHGTPFLTEKQLVKHCL